MTSATLFREGFDLDELLAELDDEFPGRVRVVEVIHGREGGVLGFFARPTVGVRFRLDESDDDDLPAWDEHVSATHHLSDDPLAELLRAAEEAEMAAVPETLTAPSRPVQEGIGEGNVEFARMLLELAAQKAAKKAADAAAQGTPRTAAQPPRTPVERAPFEPAPFTSFEPLQPLAPREIPTAVAPTIAPASPTSPTVATPAKHRARTVGAHRAADEDVASAATPAAATPTVSVTPAPTAEVPATPVVTAAETPAPSIAETAVPAVRVAPTITAPTAPAVTTAAPTAPAPAAPAPAVPSPAARVASSPLRDRLAEIGVPTAWLPTAIDDAYQAVAALAGRLPVATTPALEPGRLLVIAGPAGAAFAAARQLCREHRLDPATSLHAAGCEGRVPADELPAGQVVRHAWEAARLAAQTRLDHQDPKIVVVATDDHGADDDPDGRWATGLVTALAPDVLWLAVDAASKPADIRAQARRLGTVAALAVAGTARTASPASVWDVELPVALLDGRRATRGAWISVLLDALGELER